MRKFTFPAILALLFPLAGLSQNAEVSYKKQHYKAPLAARVDVQAIPLHFRPSLITLEMPAPGSGSYMAWLNSEKEKLVRDFVSQPGKARKQTGNAPSPLMLRNFNGNTYFDGVPNDNDLSISNGGKIISCINSNIFMMNTTGAMEANTSLADFAAPLNLNATKYDPRTMYDPDWDRFIMVFLSGFTDANSNVIIGFSQTNDPTGNWNLYSLDGTPNDDTTWTDFPMIGLTKDEFFVTGNAIITGAPWETGFKQTYIWQIDKSSGFNGDSLGVEFWQDIKYGGRSIRNLMPVKGGSQLYGPNMYFISNRNFDVTNDTVFIVEINDTANTPGLSLNVNVRKTNVPYGFPPNGRQKFNQFFATNDGRFLSSFYENDIIQFAGNCMGPVHGFASIYHGTIQNVATTKDVSGVILEDSLLDYGYPNLSFVGVNPGDNNSIIHYNFSSPDSFDGVGAIFYDGLGVYSNALTVKAGVNFVNVLQSAIERWGDYSGSQPKYDEPGVIWVSGSYGRITRDFGTWIAELTTGPSAGQKPPAENFQAINYPNPARDMVSVEFELSGATFLDIALYNTEGKLVKLLLSDLAKGGPNRFSFSTESLDNGTYFLNIRSGNQQLASKKIIVQK